jgi:hypothetical protein
VILTNKERDAIRGSEAFAVTNSANDRIHDLLDTIDAFEGDAKRLAEKLAETRRFWHSCERGREELNDLCLPGNVCSDCALARAVDSALAAHTQLSESSPGEDK